MSKHKYNETMEMLKAVDKVRMCQAMADIERVRLGGYTVDLAGGYHDNKKVRRVEARVLDRQNSSDKKEDQRHLRTRRPNQARALGLGICQACVGPRGQGAREEAYV